MLHYQKIEPELEHFQRLTTLHQQSQDTLWTIDDFTNLFNLVTTRGWFILQAKEYIGYILWQEVISTVDLINWVIVPEYRGRNQGQNSFGDWLQYLTAENIKQVFLEVSTHNHIAHHIYQKYGFRITHLRKNYYQYGHKDAYAMIRDDF